MDKYSYLRTAIQHELYMKRHWVFSCFTVVQEGTDEWKKDPYPYRLVQTPTGFYYVLPDGSAIERIEGNFTPGRPLYLMKEPIRLKAGELPNVKQDMVVSMGNVLFNLCSIIYAFGSKMDFIQGRVDIGKIEKEIALRLQDTPQEHEPRDPKALYVDEYLRFANSFNYLTEFNTICTIALTPKAISQAPGTIELRNKLVEENKDHLDDPLVVAKIEAELIKHDTEFLKGDPSEDFLISKKARTTARKKLFMDYGADPGLTKTFKVDMIQKSLSEGWDVSKIPTMVNALRAGSYDRGAETALGGEAVKWLQRASSNINIIDTDCGVRYGLPIDVSEYNLHKLVGMNLISKTGTVFVKDKEQAGTYLGKRIMIRSPLYCKLDKTDYCKVCAGQKLSDNPNSASIAISKLGSNFLSASLKRFHSSSLTRATFQVNNLIS